MSKHISHLTAILYALAAYMVWTVTDSLLKLSGQSQTPVWQIIEIIALTSMVTILTIAAARGRVKDLKPINTKLVLLRSFCFLGLSWANIVAFTNLPLTTVYVVLFLGPLLITVLAALLMGEHLSWRIVLATCVGFVGVLVALNPAQVDLQAGTLAGYMALPFCLLFYIVITLLARFMGRTESAISIAFYPSFVRFLVMIPFCLWHFEPMTVTQWTYLIAAGVLGGAGGWMLMAMALKHAPAGLISSMHYSQIVSGAVVGYLIWQDVPSWHLIVGACIIIAAGIYTGQHVHRNQLKPDQPLPA